MEETILVTSSNPYIIALGELIDLWESAEQWKALREEPLHWKVLQEAQGKTSNMKKELWEELKDRFRRKLKFMLLNLISWGDVVTGTEYILYQYQLQLNKLIGRWKKCKVEARMIPTNEPASRRVELLLAQIESEIAAVIIVLQAGYALRPIVRRLSSSGVWCGGQPLINEAWINEAWINEAARLMKAEEECMQSLKDTFTKLELDLMGTEKDSREKAEEEAQMYPKTYSPGSLEFRSTYVSYVQGAYVWIMCREPASRIRRGYCRPGQTKIEARYKPPRVSGKYNYISLGWCATHEEAGIKKEIAAFYYGQHTGWLDFEDDHPFRIPSTPTEQEQARLSVKDKREWVISKVMEVYEDVKKFRANIPTSTVHRDEQTNAGHHCSRPAEQFELPASERPSVEENLLLSEDIGADFCKFLECFLDSPQITPDLPDAEPQHVKDNDVPGAMNVVHGSSEVAASGLTNEGALHNPQAVSEFRPTMSPVSTLQQHSDPMATPSDMVTPSVVHLCPGNSTSDLLALEVIRLLVQQIEEKDKRIEEQNKRIEENDNRLAELEREVERLRGTSQH